jgi:4-carboxymuconolactone decarboxylase
MARLPEPSSQFDKKTQVLYDDLVKKRGQIDGMYRTLLNHPEMLRHVSDLGTYFRFGDSVLPDRLREMIILFVARSLGVPYEWVKHMGPAKAAGLPEDVMESIRDGGIPTQLSSVEAASVSVADYVVKLQSIPDELQQSLIESIGTKGLIEIVVLCGFYRMIAGVIRAFNVPLPEGEEKPF